MAAEVHSILEYCSWKGKAKVTVESGAHRGSPRDKCESLGNRLEPPGFCAENKSDLKKIYSSEAHAILQYGPQGSEVNCPCSRTNFL